MFCVEKCSLQGNLFQGTFIVCIFIITLSCSGVIVFVIGKMYLVCRAWAGLHFYQVISIRLSARVFRFTVNCFFASGDNVPCICPFSHCSLVVFPPSLLYQSCTVLLSLLPQGRGCSLLTRPVSKSCNLHEIK